MMGTTAVTRVLRLFRSIFQLSPHTIMCVNSTWKISRPESNVSIEPYPRGPQGMCAGLTLLWLKKSLATSDPLGIRGFDDLGRNPLFEASVIEGAHIMSTNLTHKDLNIQSFAEIHVDFTTLINDLDFLLGVQGMEYWDATGGQGLFNPLQVAQWVTLQPSHCLFSFARKDGTGHVIGIRYDTTVQILDANTGGLIESINTPIYAIRAYLQFMTGLNNLENYEGWWAVVRVRVKA